MKKLSLLFSVFLLMQFTTLAQQGWFWQNPIPTGNFLYSVDFVDELTGWAVGSRGTIIKTADGGTTWTLQTSGTYTGLKDVCFTDSDNGTVVGEDTDGGVMLSFGIILRTTNGGSDWITHKYASLYALYGVSFTDSDNGTAVGSGGRILRTTNGGVIPVELISFTASISEGRVYLNWSTATETNNLGFEIERKILNNQNLSAWEKIGFREGHGTTTEQQEYSYTDDVSTIQASPFAYRLKQIDFDGSYEYSDEVLVDISVPADYTLQQNYPNPFNPSTTIQYSIKERSSVELVLYDILGGAVEVLVNEEQNAGYYKLNFNAERLASGLYFYRIQARKFVDTKKMLLIK